MPDVICNPQPYPYDPTVLEACQTIVDQMDTSMGHDIFAQEDIYDPDLENPLPFNISVPYKGNTRLPILL